MIELALEQWVQWNRLSDEIQKQMVQEFQKVLGREQRRNEEPLPDLLRRGPDPLPAHTGLWLDRCLIEPQDGEGDGFSRDHPGRQALYEAAIESLKVHSEAPAVVAYREIFARWERLLRQPVPGLQAVVIELRAKSRILLHPATDATVTKGGILLHHTYGVPYLPGTAVKGICRARARTLLNDSSKEWEQLFGKETDKDQESESGLFDFWDALWIPQAPEGDQHFSPLALDVVNPHHSEYYTQQTGRPPPLDADQTIPTHLLTIRPGTLFLLRIETPALPGLGDWLDWLVDQLLLPTLTENGIGARTTSGYGRLHSAQPRPKDAARHSGSDEEKTSGRSLWDIGEIIRQPNDGTLIATLRSGGTAEVRGEAARAIYGNLSVTVKERLKRKKRVRLKVVWSQYGNIRRIEGLYED